MTIKSLLALLLCCLSLLPSAFANSLAASSIDIIAHRGASGFLPEHTKEALVLSFMQGADYIEQDLVATKDGQLVVLHDIHLETVTNVEQVFPKRARANGRFYAIDFTLDELRLLRIHERQNEDHTQVYPERYQGNAYFTIATFAEHVELIQELNRLLNKHVGIYPEIKAPAWHLSEGTDITALLIAQIRLLKLDAKDQKMFVQSFDPEALKRLHSVFKGEVKLIQLIAENEWNESTADYRRMLTDAGLTDIASYANGIGPWIPQIYDINNNQSTGLIKRAHAEGLLVHPYTFRTDVIEKNLAPEKAFYLLKQAGINGLFTDQVMDYMISR